MKVRAEVRVAALERSFDTYKLNSFSSFYLIHNFCLIDFSLPYYESDFMKALSLFSGGLDSILAVKIIGEQGVNIFGVFLETPFFSSQKAVKSAEYIELPLRVIDVTDSFLNILLNPKHGYGKGLNPCIDCHAFMFKKVGNMMKEEGADFIISGEVLGQRPMSQNLRSMTTVSHESNFKDLILRPLCAKRLPETFPETQGWVNREKLLGLSGRSRKPQIELAKKLDIYEYPAPAGGCLLTDKIFSGRLKDLISTSSTLEKRDLELLKWGRHFRIGEKTRIIVGRDQRENEMIYSQKKVRDTILTIKDYPGPTVLATGDLSSDELDLAASMAVSYSDAPSNCSVQVRIKWDDKQWTVSARGRGRKEFAMFMI